MLGRYGGVYGIGRSGLHALYATSERNRKTSFFGFYTRSMVAALEVYALVLVAGQASALNVTRGFGLLLRLCFVTMKRLFAMQGKEDKEPTIWRRLS